MVLTSKLSSGQQQRPGASSSLRNPIFSLWRVIITRSGQEEEARCDLCRVQGPGLPKETIIKLESVMALMGQTRTKRSGAQRREALVVNSISRWQCGEMTWHFIDNSDNHISTSPTIHQWLGKLAGDKFNSTFKLKHL